MTLHQAKIEYIAGANTPDEYDVSLGLPPPHNFVVSRDKEGKPLSCYGHLTWDRTPYQKRAGHCFLTFKYWKTGDITVVRQQLADEMRWLLFVLIYIRDGSPLGNGTLLLYSRKLCVAARYCEEHAITLHDYLTDPRLVARSIGEGGSSPKQILALIHTLKKIGPELTGLDIAGGKALWDLKKNP